MSLSISRRDFLKAAGALPFGIGLASALGAHGPLQPLAGDRKNVLIVVFDAFSARHMSLYGYARETTPNLARLAERAIVYHNHYASSSFTTPSTASLLTGVLPWTHRAFGLTATVSPAFARKTMFRAFSDYHRILYSHNPLIYYVCDPFAADLDENVPLSTLLLTGHGAFSKLFARDEDIANMAWVRALESTSGEPVYSSYLSRLREAYVEARLSAFLPYFPLGVPNVTSIGHYLLEDAIDWLAEAVGGFPRPYLAYYHLLPPHDPSAPPEDFYRHFTRDGYRPPVKPVDVLTHTVVGNDQLLREHREYDEFILYVDREFGRLFDILEFSGALENTWIILTSDHGELFERGHSGHLTPMLYESVLRVPLMVFEPGRTSRLDVHAPTSVVDLLPTLLHATGHDPIDWAEGSILPPFASPDTDRPLFALYSKDNDPRMRLTKASAVVVKGVHKLSYVFGYPELGGTGERIELYDIQSDPDELRNLYPERKDLGDALLASLKDKLRQVDEPYL